VKDASSSIGRLAGMSGGFGALQHGDGRYRRDELEPDTLPPASLIALDRHPRS
jgi:hypothetical protein